MSERRRAEGNNETKMSEPNEISFAELFSQQTTQYKEGEVVRGTVLLIDEDHGDPRQHGNDQVATIVVLQVISVDTVDRHVNISSHKAGQPRFGRGIDLVLEFHLPGLAGHQIQGLRSHARTIQCQRDLGSNRR